MSIFDNPMMSPENLFALSGNMFAAPNFGAGLGAGLQQVSQNFATQREQAQEKQVENRTRQFVQRAFPNEDVANMPPPVLKQFAEQAIKQRFQPKNDWQFLQSGDKIYLGDQNTGSIKELANNSRPDLPPIAKEYEWAKQNGFKGTPQEYQAYKAGLNKSGFMVDQTEDGVRVYQGDPASIAKMTEGQSKDVNWLYRGTGANQELSKIDNMLTSLPENVASDAGRLGNYFKSPEYQQAERAGKEFLAVVLRKDTGAAVTKEELQLYGPMYLPQPGDKPPVLRDKAIARQRFLQGLGLGIPKKLRDTVPGSSELFPDPNAPQTIDQSTTEPKRVTLPDGTQGTIRRTK